MAAVLKLLERQLGAWDLKRRLEDVGQRAGRWLEGHVAYGPCLVVSRQRGSEGDRIAHLVGERLGWHVFDREIVDAIAERAHVREQLMASVGQETRETWDRTWKTELAPQDIGYEDYLRCLRQVVLTLGHHGDVVVLGRGAQYLLPGRSALRVRVVAPLELRVQRVAEREKISLLEADAQVCKFDSEQAEFISKCFNQDLDSPLGYDLILNTASIRIECAAELVLLGLRDKLGLQPRKA